MANTSNESWAEPEVAVITKRAPSGAVSVTYNRDEGLKVLLADGELAAVNERTFVGEIEEAILGIWQELAARSQGVGGRAEPIEVSELELELLHEIETFECTGRSTEGHVEASIFGEGEVIIKFRGNVLRRTDVTTRELESEINQAIGYAKQVFTSKAKETVKAYRDRLRVQDAVTDRNC